MENRMYVGTRLVFGDRMTRLDYNKLRGWDLPSDENGDDDGYKVTDTVSGHVSWLPTDEFQALYSQNGNFDFGAAVRLVKEGYKVARKGWNGKGMFIFLVPGSTFKVNRAPLLGIYPEGTEITYQPHIDMKTADGRVVPWLASQSDMLGNDWMIV